MNKVSLKKWSGVIAVFLLAVLFNCILCLGCTRMGLMPVLGIAGSMSVAVMSGYFLGVWAVFVTELIVSLFIKEYIYYGFINVLSVIITTYYYKKGYFKKKSGIFTYLIFIAGINTILTSLIQLQSGHLSEDLFTINAYSTAVGSLPVNMLARSSVIVFTTAIISHVICLMITYIVVRIVPADIKKLLNEFGWLQKPVKDSELEQISKTETRKTKIGTVFAISLISTCLIVLIVVAMVASSLFVQHTMDQRQRLAVGASHMVANIIDGDRVDLYIQSKGNTQEYKDIKGALENIKKMSDDIEYIYVYKITEDGCVAVFDIDTPDMKAADPGELVPFDASVDEYIPALLKGERIEPFISNEYYGWLLTSFIPVYNSDGETVCYACADVSMKYLGVYRRNFVVRILILCSGMIVVIIVTGLWVSKYRVVYPVDTMVMMAKDFRYDSEEAKKANLALLNKLEIRTGDEIERLYNSFVQVAKDSSKSFSKMVQKTDYIEKMQSDLIVILADMVENRDESTGDHIRKTSMYTLIIMRQMRRMGIKSGMLTDDYIQDVYKSAPLHDIGKIRIPDAILNKPGKLTPEEFDIMKKHSVYGGAIIDELIESLPQASYLEVARDIALYHHERWDGTGYPEGLKGEEIPLPARIMAVADVFDALISDRVYKKAFSFEKAMDIIKEESGTHFDPDIVKAFFAVADEAMETAKKQSGS